MAGAGFRTFTAGAILTAAQVQNFLQDQAVQVYADASARTTALGTALSEGMVSYLTGTNVLQYYDGSAWLTVLQNSNASVATAATGSTVLRNIRLATTPPTGGADGDVWLVYTP